MVSNTSHIRSDKDLNKLINNIRVKFMQNGLKPPTIVKITKVIARKVKEEDILFDKAIRFK